MCLDGEPGVPTVFVDSVSSQVNVVKFDGGTVEAFKDLLLCPGDEILTSATGRVAIRFDDKRTIVRFDGNSRAKILSGGTGEGDVALLDGILHFLSSVRQRFQVDTPYAVAGIDGTEALITVERARRLALAAVRQGLISAYNHQISRKDPILVEEGEAAFTSPRYRLQSAPIAELPAEFLRLVIVSDSAVDWAVYYPPILLVRDVANSSVRRAIKLLSSGDYDRAAVALDAASGVEPAATAALRAIIAVGRNRLPEAEKWSELALKADPDFAPAHVAASYVRQAQGDLEGALQFAGKAAEIGRNDAYAIARLAELQMTVGDRRAALKTANRSLDVAPNQLALFVAGLANLVAWDYSKAEEQFLQGIAIDDQLPLLRLGLGLLYIRQGMTAAGAWEIERAAAHDPNRASLRTWLGRAYYDEGLTQKAVDQFRLAKELDRNDPQPYVFSALERYGANDPIGALRELQGADERGGARRVIRSERGLGEDTATIGAALGRVFDVLGFDQLAINEGAKAAVADPANPGGHRFLVDAYRQRPDSGIAQTSELLRSQLLSPPSKTPVQPELAEARLALLDTTGPSRVTFAEFAPLFDSDGLRVDASGLFGTQNTWGDQVSVTGLYRGASLSVGQFHYETDGFRANNDLSHDIFNAVSTVALSPEFTLFGEYLHRETEGGDRRLNFEIDTFDPNLRSDVERKVARFGFHAQPTPDSDLIGVYTSAKLTGKVSTSSFFGDVAFLSEDDSHSGQLQYLRNDGIVRSVVGGAYFQNDIRIDSEFGGTAQPTEFSDSVYYNAYTYFDLDLTKQLTLTVGGSVVSYRLYAADGVDVSQFHPKIGATVELNEYITVRAAYFRSIKPDLVSDELIEPTTIAGFNQVFDALNGSVVDQIGGGIDIMLNDRSWIGVEAVARWWDVPINGAPDAETMEQVYRGYVYVTVSDDIALSTGILYETSTSDVLFDFEKWQTTSVPVTLSYFGDSGLFGSIGVEFVDHNFNNFGVGGQDRFSLFNAALGYRLPGNAGIFSIEVQNLFDEDFQFQNRTLRPDLTATPRYAPERTILARGTVHF